VLRLAFHDAATYDAAAGDGGANASVRLELERPENRGLRRGWRVIEMAMAGGLRSKKSLSFYFSMQNFLKFQIQVNQSKKDLLAMFLLLRKPSSFSNGKDQRTYD